MKFSSHQKTFKVMGQNSSTKSHPSSRRVTLWRRIFMVNLGALVLTLVYLAPAWATDGSLDLSFNPGTGVGRAPILWGQYNYTDGSGKALIAGAFTMVGDKPHASIARLNSDLSPDETFQAPAEIFEVRNVVLLTPNLPNNASNILINGVFSVTAGGKTYNGLARLLPSGAVDTSFVSSFEVGGDYVSGISLQPDGKILVVGASMVVKGYPGVYCFLRLNADGSVDDFYPMRLDSGGYIHNVYAYPSTGTSFPNGARLSGTIPRFDGSGHLDYLLILDSNGNTVLKRLGDEDIDGPVIGVSVQPSDGKVLIAGMFSRVYGQSRNGIARLSADMLSLDSLTNFNPGAGANYMVRGAVVQNDGKIVLRGFFTSFNGDPSRKYIVRLQSSGTVDDSFKIGAGPDDCVWSMWQTGDGSWMVLGAFREFDGISRHGIAKLNSDGSIVAGDRKISLYNDTIGKVYATTLQDDGKILIGGSFSSCGGKYHGGIARLNPDGTTDETFQGRASSVRRIAVQPDDKILIAGPLYSTTGYMARTGVARMNPDGTMDNTFNPKVLQPDGCFGYLNAVRILDNGQIMIAGDFSTVNGMGRSIAARLDSNGTLDASFTVGLTLPGTNIVARRVVPTAGDKYLLLGNYIPTDNSTTQGFLTRLLSSGGIDPTWGPNPNQNQNIVGMSAASSTMALQTDGKVLVCGDFTQIYANFVSERSHIARITAGGQLDTTFIPLATNDSIKTMALQRNSKVLIGGSFTSPFNRLARLNPSGTLDSSFDPGEGVDSTVNNFVHIPAQGKAFIAGEFTNFNGQVFSRPGIAKILASDGAFPLGILLLLD